jgi:hypothetical protein
MSSKNGTNNHTPSLTPSNIAYESIRQKVVSEEDEQMTVVNAFDDLYSRSEEVNVEKGTRAIAFLLRYFSDAGGDAVDGMLAYGLGTALYKLADDQKRIRSRRKIDEQIEEFNRKRSA